MTKPADSLRKAAILVSILDRRSADALLDSMPEALAARVRQAVLNLDEVAPDEQQRIISEFLAGQAGAASSGGVELDVSLAGRLSSGSAAGVEPAAKPSDEEPPAHFRFLHTASSETVAKVLQREHPQTAALVIAHLAPGRAAEVIATLPSRLQVDVLKRVAGLEETSPEVLSELEQSFEHLLASEAHSQQRRTIGLAAVDAILNAVPGELRRTMLTNLARADSDLADRLQSAGDDDFEEEAPAPASKPTRRPFFWPRFKANASRAVSPRSEIEEDRSIDEESDADDAEFEEATGALREPELVDFEDFLRFDDRSLALVLKAADSRLAMLALTGARTELVERLLAQLPAKQARNLRQRMELSGPLRLRDVEVAQRQLAKVAQRLAAQGEIDLPRPRRFAAAA